MFDKNRRRIYNNSARVRRSILSMILRWGLLAVTIIVVLGVGIVWLWLRSGMAPQSGTVELKIFSAPVTISRDTDGVPIIRAENDLDAYRALGYLHASERLFQMDLVRHFTSGRVSELIGASGLPTDKLMRTLGLRTAAIGSYQVVSPAVKAALEAYAEGVNSIIDGSAGVGLPPEYRLLPSKPEPWQPIDSVQWQQFMAFDLSYNMWSELRHAKLAAKLDPRLYAEIYASEPDHSYATMAAKQSKTDPLITQLAENLSKALPRQIEIAGVNFDFPAIGIGGASNEWIVAPSHTDTGGAILANDPHLRLGMPSIWYLAEIYVAGDGKNPPKHVIGGTAPSTPFMLLGRNENIAWGITSTNTDTEDLFIEKLTTGKPGYYDTPNGPKAFETHDEVINIKGGGQETITIRRTRHGPVLSDIVPPYLSDSDHVIALQAVMTEPNNRAIEAFYHLERVKNWDEFKAAVAFISAPTSNVAYADRQGHIGLIGAGAFPVRKKGDGLSPVPGWSGEYDWLGLVPPANRPQIYDPPSGMIINANNRLVDNKYPYFLGLEWHEDFRARQIVERLMAAKRFSVKDMIELQNDVESQEARELLPRLLRVEGGSAAAQSARERLRTWNHRMNADRPEPLIWAAWVRQLQMRLFAQALAVTGKDDVWVPNITTLARILGKDSLWCALNNPESLNNPLTAETQPQSCDGVILAALEAAMTELKAQYGSDTDQWQWGVAHQAKFQHHLFSHIPILRNIVGLNVPMGGGSDTVARANYHRQDNMDGRFDFKHGPGYRAVYDLSQPLAAYLITVPGQSGLPMSPHLDDLVGRWQRGSLLSLGQELPENSLAHRQVLTLKPVSH